MWYCDKLIYLFVHLIVNLKVIFYQHISQYMFFLSNIVPNRQDEIEGIKEILNHLDVGVIKLPEFMHIEGGDVIVHNDKVFIGTYSEEDYPSLITARTNNESIDYLKRIIIRG